MPHLEQTEEHPTDTSMLIPMDQKLGLKNITDYLSGNVPFGELRPFVLNSPPDKLRSSNSSYVGRIDGKEIYITLNPQIVQAIEKGKSILVTPQQDEDCYYQWLDFYSRNDTGADLEQKIGSFRIDQENKRLVGRGWYGYERQLFIDFVTGNRALHPSQLKPFNALSTRFQTVNIGYQEEKPIGLKISELKLEAGQQITFIPKYDEQRGYTWIEGYMEKDGKSVLVCTRRINAGIPTFDQSAWKGLEIQSMIDWIGGKLPIDLTNPLKIPVEGIPPRVALEDSTQRKIVLGLDKNTSLLGAKEIILVPKQDELYQWIEIYRDDAGVKEGYTLANYYRVFPSERNKLQGGWIGPEAQRYFDYLDGKINFENLREMTLSVQAHATVSLFTFKGKHLSLQLHDLVNFPVGQEVKIIPSLSTKGGLIIEVTKTGTAVITKRFIYDPQTKSFRVANEQNETLSKPTGYWTPENVELETRNFYEQEGSLGFLKQRRNDLYIASRRYPGGIEALERKLDINPAPQVDKDSSIYTDKEGRDWTYAYFLAQELGFNPASAIRILSESRLPSILGRAKSGAEVPLYNLADAKRILLGSGYLERKIKPRPATYSLEEIISNLDPQNPQVIRDKGGRIRWTYQPNTKEQNLRMGINNIQAIFLQALPEFNELFPRIENQHIDPKLVKAARAFIEDKIGTPEKFQEIMGFSADNLRSTSYFQAGLSDVIQKCFVDWGIEFKDEERLISLVDISGTLNGIQATEQQSGTRALKMFMTGQKPYEKIQPFLISNIPGNTERGYHLTIYTYSGEAKTGTVTLSPNLEMKRLIIEGKSMVCIPKKDSNNFYQWLEIFEVLEGNIFDSNKSVGSYRIDSKNQRIETLGWYGPENQTFLDYLTGQVDLNPKLLSGFKSKVKHAGNRFYTNLGSANSKHFRISLNDSENSKFLSGAQEINFRPRTDAERGYSWLEGYIEDDQGKEILVCNRRFIRGEANLSEWRGPEFQAIIDWIKGSLPVEKTSPISVTLNSKSLALFFAGSEESRIILQFADNRHLKQGDTLHLIPQTDGSFEWIDIYKVDKESNTLGILITKALVVRNKKYKLQAQWVGPERHKEMAKTINTPKSPDEANEYLRRLVEG